MRPATLAASLASAAVAAVGCPAVIASPAAGSETLFPTQRQSDRGLALSYASGPPRPAGLCIVDSGLTLNGAVQPVVVDREALDGGDPGDVSSDLHGTRMAMEAAAVPASPGIVGAAPNAVRVISIRATNPANELTFDAYKQGILLCELRAPAYNIKVINLSLGFQGTPTPEQLTKLEDAVKNARGRFGIDVVAAIGNEGGSQVSYPAAAPGVLAVGASNAQREPCSFSNKGPQLALLAPGCDLEEANPLTRTVEYNEAGTSFSAVDDAAVLAALRAYRPDLSAEGAEQLMHSTVAAAGGVLDVSALFGAAGLSGVIADGEAHEPRLAPTPSPASPQTASSTPKRHTLRAKPRIWSARRGKMLVVRLLNFTRGERLAATLLGPLHHHRRQRLRRMSTLRHTISLPAMRDALLMLVYTDPAGRAVSPRASLVIR